ncbi:hypothetical protein LOZ80_37890 [Paenibacillus sp. HWE-109]|uniref:hypothetical protein n=1 Tax=Paenibacillus sp. HWE-109 TaxID=1306526 RepID=UPI001EDD44E7|nr:hypothetical protein [Paenibacillus sp. HWE-109]UKS27164.1 hypothetical protein LOZ80_37890 [Paenibacillus sp. HWE-109]
MAKISVYYEEHEINGMLRPTRVNLYFGRGVIDWKRQSVYLPFDFKFKKMTADDVFPEVTSVMIMAGDLFRHPIERKFGIYLPPILDRLTEDKKRTGAKYEIEDIEQFIIMVHDIEAAIQTALISLYDKEDF